MFCDMCFKCLGNASLMFLASYLAHAKEAPVCYSMLHVSQPTVTHVTSISLFVQRNKDQQFILLLIY